MNAFESLPATTFVIPVWTWNCQLCHHFGNYVKWINIHWDLEQELQKSF